MSGAYVAANDVDVDLRSLFGSLARRWPRILIVALLVTAAAYGATRLITPLYKSETKISIEQGESSYTRPNVGSNDDKSTLDEEGVTSQIELITSTNTLKQVVTDLNAEDPKLDLAKLPEFDEAADMSMLDHFLVIVGAVTDPNEIPIEERVLKRFREKLKVYRVEKSRVIVVEMTSEDPQLAARISEAVAKAYLKGQTEAKLGSNTEAAIWLDNEIKSLREQVKDAEAKVADFRASSDLLIGQNNSMLATQQLSEISTELSRVRANRAAAAATADSLRAALKGGAALDALPEVLQSELIQRLRERQVQLKADIADLSTTLLDSHPRIRALRSQLADLDTQIRTEAGKVLTSLETQAQTAQFREKQLLADLNTQKAASARAGDQEVELNALEREAAAARQQLESYLSRYREAASRQQQLYYPADARIASGPTLPVEPYFPKVVPIVGAALVGSLLIMAIVTLLQELFSGRAMRPARGFEPVADIEMPVYENEPLGVETAAPTAEPQPAVTAAADAAAASASSGTGPQPKPGIGEISAQAAASRLIADGATRAIFVSPEGDEAAASAVLVAREVADAGLRVLLLDLTASGAASRPMLESSSYAGITNLLASEAQFADVIHADLYSDCHVIPVGTADPVRAMRAADRLPIIMDSLTTAYDVVVVECGAADPESIRRLIGAGTEVLVSVLETGDVAVTDTADRLKASGYSTVTLVSPAAPQPPRPPLSDRSAA
jgi:exopolysaccharide transport family protein